MYLGGGRARWLSKSDAPECKISCNVEEGSGGGALLMHQLIPAAVMQPREASRQAGRQAGRRLGHAPATPRPLYLVPPTTAPVDLTHHIYASCSKAA